MAKYDGSEGGVIPLAEAAEWTANYRKQTPDPDVARAHVFGRNILQKLLAQKRCVGIRMYYGLKPADNEEGYIKQLVLVGVDAEGNDLVAKGEGEDVTSEDDLVVDRSSICPPDCGSGSVLDGGG